MLLHGKNILLNGSISFSFSGWVVLLCICAHHILSVCSRGCRHVACLPLLAIEISAAVNIGVQVCVCVCVCVQLPGCVRLLWPPWTAASKSSLPLSISQSLPKFMSLESVMPSNRHTHCCPLLLLPSVFPSIRVFFSESALCIRWPKDWSFSFNISPSNEQPGLAKVLELQLLHQSFQWICRVDFL